MYVRPSGNLKEGLVFAFYAGSADKEPTTFTIVRISVIRREGENHFTNVWHVNGRRQLSVMKYGEPAAGLVEDSAAQALRPGRYEIAVDTADGRYCPVRGGIPFDIMPDGTVAMLK